MRWAVVLIVVAGCTESPAQRAEEVCSTFCDCAVGTGQPEQVQSCIDTQCLPQLPPVTDTCLACVHQHESTCSVLQNDCLNLCLGTAQPDLLGGSR
jgi:hypothetical protein